VTERRHPGPGLFIVVEGPEGSGKSTLTQSLAAMLDQRGVEPVMVREPGGTAVAEGVRRILLDPGNTVAPLAELYLFLAARSDLVAGVIRPALEEGRVVLADRFALSTEVYQIDGRGLDATLVHRANEAAVSGAEPDLILVLDIDAEHGLGRQRAGGLTLDRLDREEAEFHRRVVEGYRNRTGHGIVHLDARQAPDRVAHSAWQVIEDRFPETFGAQGSLAR